MALLLFLCVRTLVVIPDAMTIFMVVVCSIPLNIWAAIQCHHNAVFRNETFFIVWP
jgi:hypothetical protein